MWGDPIEDDDQHTFELILASDILLYVKEFPKLLKTIAEILKDHGVMWLNNRRRIDTEEVFLNLCRTNKFQVTEIFPKIFEIKK